MLAISIGISRCLIGDSVRYDGEAKYSNVCNTELATLFKLIPVCPEVESGLSTPRPPVEIIQTAKGIRVIGRDDPSLDVTDQLTTFCNSKVPLLNSLSGFVLTPRSPSCGLSSVPIKTLKGAVLNSNANGMFAESLSNYYPYLPLIEEPFLDDPHELSLFKIRVIFYYLIQHEWLTSKNKKGSGFSLNILGINGTNISKEQQHDEVNNVLSGIKNKQAITLLNSLTEHISEH